MTTAKEFDETEYQQMVSDVLAQTDRSTALQMIHDIFIKKNKGEIDKKYGERLANDLRIQRIISPLLEAKGFGDDSPWLRHKINRIMDGEVKNEHSS